MSAGRHVHSLRLRRGRIDTYQEAVIYMRRDCPVCRSEGFSAQARVQIRVGDRTTIATLNIVDSELLQPGEAALSEAAWNTLQAEEGDLVAVSHAPPLDSLGLVRGKIYGRTLDSAAMTAIVTDIVAGLYSDIHIAAFVTACGGDRLSLPEIVDLTRAMMAAGDRITWPMHPVVDKHCVGGLPGNRTTPIIVSIVSALGLAMPKTSSRAITSPAGTADTMETMAPVDLDLPAMRRVVEQEGGCIVWGGAVRLSPADDLLIRVERTLDLDSEGQLIASVLSKKAAAGSSHVVVDLPVGPTAKVRSAGAAASLQHALAEVGTAVGLDVQVVVTDGTAPVGRGLGPALEAKDVLAVLRGDAGAPTDLRDRSVLLAGRVLEGAGRVVAGGGEELAAAVLRDGRAWKKFQAICEAQGGMRTPPTAPHTHPFPATRSGRVVEIDNRRLSRLAKLAGAPKAPAAGLVLQAAVGQTVERHEPLFTLHAETPGELAYALSYAEAHPEILRLEEA